MVSLQIGDCSKQAKAASIKRTSWNCKLAEIKQRNMDSSQLSIKLIEGPKAPNTKAYNFSYLFCLSLLICSPCLNFFFISRALFRSPEPSWSSRAATEAEAVAARSCSGHGSAFVDGILVDGKHVCECNACYRGPDCSEFVQGCAADAESGDPLFLEPYWRQHAASSAVVVAGWHRMSYQTDGDYFISIELERHIRKLHSHVGNAITDGRFIIFGAGSTQLINAAVHALSPNSTVSSPASVVASVPYYMVYRTQTEFFNSRAYEWKGVTSKWVDKLNSSAPNFIEFVTSPNNPDGRMQQPILPGSSVIYDHAYYWPHFSAIKAPADGDLMLFTISKLTGHAGSRFGWAIVKDEGVYKRMLTYLGINTMGVSRDTQLRSLKLLKAVLGEERGAAGSIFEFAFRTMRERWHKLNKLVSSSDRFSLQQTRPEYCNYFGKIRDPSPAYAWLKCEREEDKNCYAVLRAGGIISRSGYKFGADGRYTRLSLIRSQDDFDLLIRRMDALITKEKARNM
ncbi:tryptophan aminotransferase-related protein 3 [Elaeis guineensis]|uniref:Tryptophan aminotransferase-related protein 3 n=1 Tax=Elaeis guineensis var. tenera TaxID=51953 RepID=A0A6I9QY66_ELAGV|nr:tryptophan aminotransferase-related protein 3 [Elaeis guineensis]